MMKRLLNKRIRFSSTQRGFTLLETLVAIGVLSIALGTTLTLAQKVLSSSMYSRDEITAFFLAAEGIEIVRSIKDNRAISNIKAEARGEPRLNWLIDFSSAFSGVTCRSRDNETAQPVCSIGYDASISSYKYTLCSPVCPSIKRTDDGLYNYTTGTDTKYKRAIVVKESKNNRQARVRVIVTWDSKEVVVEENIFNWHCSINVNLPGRPCE